MVSFPRLFSCSILLPLLSLSTLAQTAPPKDSDLQAAATLYRDKGCAFCHGPALAGTPKGPALADIQKDKEWTAAKMTDQLLNGGKKMPPFRESLTDDEVAQLVTYLRAAKRPLPPPLAGDSAAPASPTPQN